MSGAVRVAVVLAGAAAAAFVASFMLLGLASGGDQVGRLTPQTALVRSTPPPPPTVVRPIQLPSSGHKHEHEHADD